MPSSSDRSPACTSPSGRPTPIASASSATSTGGTAASTRCDCLTPHGRVGDLHPGHRARREVQVRAAIESGRRLHEGRSLRAALRASAALGLHRMERRRLRVGRRGVDGGAPAAERVARSPDVGLRGAPRVVGAGRGRRAVPVLPRAGGPPRAVRARDGLHAHRAAAGDGAPVRRLVGLPGGRLLRADEPPGRAGRLQGVRGRVPPGGHRRAARLGARATSRRTRTGWRASTAPRSTSTRTRARASSWTGAR